MEFRKIDLKQYKLDGADSPHLDDLRRLSDSDQEQLIMAGVDAEEHDRAGSYLHMNHGAAYCKSKTKGVEILDIKDALKKYDGLPEYFWKTVDRNKDEYTRSTDQILHGGYFIKTEKGAKIEAPVQSCLFIKSSGVGQNVHNVIIVEEDSELHIITGCSVSKDARGSAHFGISEFFLKKNAKLTFSMIHNWGEDTAVRPRSAGIMEAGSVFLNNYVLLQPVRDLQMYPSLTLTGPEAVARFNSVIVAPEGSYIDAGSRIILDAPETKGEMIARVITSGGTCINRGHLAARQVPAKGHLECKGLILGGGGTIHAIPELEGTLPGVELSHEAAVGKIAQEEIEYLMARGMDEEEATSTIVRGFLNVDIMGLPKALKDSIDKTISESEKDMF